MADTNRNMPSGGLNKLSLNEGSYIDKVIAVVSGKGGVGKSTVTALLAVALAKEGYKVGIMDADLTGASIPYLFGLEDLLKVSENGLEPAKTTLGIKVVSIALAMENPETAVIWRGPLLSRALQQFWTDVNWGELDYLLIDMPPGTSDVPLTVMQMLPLDGVVVVTSPQDMARSVVKKAYHMANQMNIPVLGVVENMSYAVCPHCGEKFYVFGQKPLSDTAEEFGVKASAELPIDQNVAKLTDEGKIEEADTSPLNPLLETL
ncbi:Mrp/NBP35 family ATP-binding protein [Coprothermobacter platensis]|uniref:Mrp/NBP35 family ATP-binding protein n=1 Tax=Coprothermobacter platensis TaxID=108819 RepID=UPI000372B0CE|nr:Mrp/NBP35 family ATP-binding protein [Coprothermobacter platensis]